MLLAFLKLSYAASLLPSYGTIVKLDTMITYHSMHHGNFFDSLPSKQKVAESERLNMYNFYLRDADVEEIRCKDDENDYVVGLDPFQIKQVGDVVIVKENGGFVKADGLCFVSPGSTLGFAKKNPPPFYIPPLLIKFCTSFTQTSFHSPPNDYSGLNRELDIYTYEDALLNVIKSTWSSSEVAKDTYSQFLLETNLVGPRSIKKKLAHQIPFMNVDNNLHPKKITEYGLRRTRPFFYRIIYEGVMDKGQDTYNSKFLERILPGCTIQTKKLPELKILKLFLNQFDTFLAYQPIGVYINTENRLNTFSFDQDGVLVDLVDLSLRALLFPPLSK